MFFFFHNNYHKAHRYSHKMNSHEIIPNVFHMSIQYSMIHNEKKTFLACVNYLHSQSPLFHLISHSNVAMGSQKNTSKHVKDDTLQ